MLLLALGAAAFTAWKLGAPDKTSAAAKENATASLSSEGSEGGYTGRKDSKCCDKPPGKSALMRNP
jgi:hypothetical protein